MAGEGPEAARQGLLPILLTFVQQPNGPRATRTGALGFFALEEAPANGQT